MVCEQIIVKNANGLRRKYKYALCTPFNIGPIVGLDHGFCVAIRTRKNLIRRTLLPNSCVYRGRGWISLYPLLDRSSSN